MIVTALKDFFLRHIPSVQNMEPRYNINANLKRKKSVVNKLLRDNKINAIDIGCRGGLTPELKDLYKYINVIGFDADKTEIDRLNVDEKLQKRFNSIVFYEYCLGEKKEERTLYVTKSPGSSSLYRPNPVFVELFDTGGNFEVVKEIPVKTKELDDIGKKENLSDIDFLKIDTQGSELDILKGAKDHLLPDVLLIEAEAEFFEMYKNQPLFSDLDSFLRNHKFTLLFLNRVYLKMKVNRHEYSKGQIVYGDVLYARNISETKKLSPKKLVKFIILLANYGHYDYAWEVFNFNKIKLADFEELIEALLRMRKNKLFFFIGYIFSFIIGWLVFLLLWLRRWNHHSGDSDRSYPIR